MLSDKLCIFGDSISCGVMKDEASGRYTLCRDTYDRALRAQGVTVQSYAKPGCTSFVGLAAAQKCAPLPGAVAVIEFGGNDSDLKWAEVAQAPDASHEALVSLAEYKRCLIAMADIARRGGMTPVITTPLPVVHARYFRFVSQKLDADAILRHLGGTEYIYRWQERYAYAAMEAAQSAGCKVFHLRELFLERRDFYDLMCSDGIHPNAQGYALIREAALGFWNK